jgi:hypothetical protein
VYCVQDILGKGKYEELVKPLLENYHHSLALRKYLEGLDDEKLDGIVKNLDNRWADGIINKLFSNESSIDLLKWSTPFIRMLTNDNTNHHPGVHP